jgi:purine nucleosidase
VHRIILDTDIATDVDDAMALALAMRMPDIEIAGVTTVYGDVRLRARLAKKLLALGGRPDVPVFAGIERPLLQKREVWWPGHEGAGVLDDEESIAFESRHAVDFMIETVLSRPGEISIVAIGPLTNVAAALIREPSVAGHVREIVVMGGVTRLADNALELPPIEHNIKSDPEAAAVVFGSGAPIVMVGLDATMRVKIGRDEQNALTGSPDPMLNALGVLIGHWLEQLGQDWTYMHDPLTVALLADRSLARLERMRVRVEYDHREPSGTTVAERDAQGNVEVALQADSGKFLELLMERLTGA